jgi:hypothetical protein
MVVDILEDSSDTKGKAATAVDRRRKRSVLHEKKSIIVVVRRRLSPHFSPSCVWNLVPCCFL